MATINYTRRNLIPGEKIIYAATLHNFCFVFPILLLVIGILLLTIPHLAPHLLGQADPVAAQQAAKEYGYWEMAKDKFEGFFVFIGSFLPDSVTEMLSSANELRMILSGALFTLLGVVYLIAAVIKKISTEHVITNKRITFKKGFITVDESQISLYNVEGVKAFQSVLDRALNRGMVQVNGLGMEQLEIRGIADPNRFRHFAYTAVEKYSGRGQQRQMSSASQPAHYTGHLPGR